MTESARNADMRSSDRVQQRDGGGCKGVAVRAKTKSRMGGVMTNREYRLECARAEARAHLARARAHLVAARLVRDDRTLDCCVLRMVKLRAALKESD